MSGQPNRVLPPVRSAGSIPVPALARLGGRDKAPSGAPRPDPVALGEDEVDDSWAAPTRSRRPAPAAEPVEEMTLAEFLRRREAQDRKPEEDDVIEESTAPVLLSRGSSASLAARAVGRMLGRPR